MLMHYERIRNLKSSTLIFTFFMLLTLDSIVTLRHHILNYVLQVYIFRLKLIDF